ncbi:MAG: hypothetical protein R6W31_01650 [Bacteroidales bacterium]
MASKYYRGTYFKILKWGFRSKEDTNFTYHLTPDNISYLAHTIALVTKTDYSQILKYISEAQSDETLRDTIRNAWNVPRKGDTPTGRYALGEGWAGMPLHGQ